MSGAGCGMAVRTVKAGGLARLLRMGGLALVAIALSGCAAALLGGGATVGVTAAQERSVGNALDDTTTHTEINSRLLQKSQTLFSHVGVTVVEGRVLLTGFVPSEDDRAEAVKIAWSVNGVKDVLNELQVGEGGGIGSYSKDSWITAQLRGKLIGDADVLDINYNITTVNKVIYLMGIAQDQAELDRVINHARNIAGVTKVVSHVLLKNDPKRQA